MDLGVPAIIVISGFLVAYLAVLGMGSAVNQHFIATRLTHIEHRLDRIAEHLGLDAKVPPDATRARELLRAGRKVDTIKEYRARPGVGRKEAKDAIEALERDV